MLFLVLLTGILSCNQWGQESLENKDLELILVIKIPVQERIQLFYQDIAQEAFTDKKRLYKDVNPSPNFQKVKFKISTGHIPHKLRLDLGENRNENDIEISQIVLVQLDTLKMTKNNFERYFQGNKYVEICGSNFSRRVRNNEYDPYLTSTPLLTKTIQLKLTQGK